MAADQGPFRRILVICTRQIGDVLLTTPLIAAAKARWPEARIDVLGFAGTLGILRGNPHIAELIEVRAGSGWWQSLSLIKRLWRHYDLALIAEDSDRAHLYGAVAARRRSGLVQPQGRTSWWKRLLMAHAFEVRQDRPHAVLEKLELMSPWSAPPEAIRVQPPAGHALPPEIGQALAPRYVVLQVPTIVRYKQWPISHQVQLVRGLVTAGHQVVLTGGPSEADRQRTAEVASGEAFAPGAEVLDVAGRLDLNQMVTLLRGAALYIGPDTSITHLAAACDTPLIALYGPVDPRIFGPWPQGHAATVPYERHARRQQLLPARGSAEGGAALVLLQGDPACVPCNQSGCERHNQSRSDCLETMAPERVLDEALRLLAPAAAWRPRLAIPIVAASAP